MHVDTKYHKGCTPELQKQSLPTHLSMDCIERKVWNETRDPQQTSAPICAPFSLSHSLHSRLIPQSPVLTAPDWGRGSLSHLPLPHRAPSAMATSLQSSLRCRGNQFACWNDGLGGYFRQKSLSDIVLHTTWPILHTSFHRDRPVLYILVFVQIQLVGPGISLSRLPAHEFQHFRSQRFCLWIWLSFYSITLSTSRLLHLLQSIRRSSTSGLSHWSKLEVLLEYSTHHHNNGVQEKVPQISQLSTSPSPISTPSTEVLPQILLPLENLCIFLYFFSEGNFLLKLQAFAELREESSQTQ